MDMVNMHPLTMDEVKNDSMSLNLIESETKQEHHSPGQMRLFVNGKGSFDYE